MVCASVADPWHFSVYPDPDLDPHIHASDQSDPAIFLIDLQDANKKLICLIKSVFCLLLFQDAWTSFSKIKRSQSQRSHKAVGIKVILFYFCLVIEGSGSESGSIPLTNGSRSGSRRPKNTWIRIRIRNTGIHNTMLIWIQLQWELSSFLRHTIEKNGF